MSEGLSKEKQEDTKGVELTDLGDAENGETESLPLSDGQETDVLARGEADTSIEEPKDEMESSEKLEKVVASVIEQKFSGPIPPPNIIAGYESVVAGSADRIIRMAEQQSLHRQNIELMETKAEIRDSLLGVIFAFILGTGCLVACVITVTLVPAAAGAVSGAVLGITGIGSIVAAFLKNTRPPNK